MFAFAYRAPAQRAAFLRVTTEGGQALALTPRHYVYALTPAQLAAERARSGAPASSAEVPLRRWRYVEARHLSAGDYVPLAGLSTRSMT